MALRSYIAHPFPTGLIVSVTHSCLMVDYTTLKIPDEMRDEYERLNRLYKLAYASFAEFAKDAIRRRIEEIKAVYGDVA